MQCASCRHLLTVGTCRAFPAGIPLAIAASRRDHRAPFPGDGELRFSESDDPESPRRALFAWITGDREDDLAPEDAPNHPAPEPTEAPLFGDEARAPELPDQAAVRARAKSRLTTLLEEAGGPAALSTDALCARLCAAYPVTYALLERQERGGLDMWKRYVGLWHRAQQRSRRWR
jgi:hypothetical protein